MHTRTPAREAACAPRLHTSHAGPCALPGCALPGCFPAEHARGAGCAPQAGTVISTLIPTILFYSRLNSASEVSSFTKIRLPEMAGCAQVAESATLYFLI